METFPLKPDQQIEVENLDPAIVVTFENGTEQIRHRWSKPKKLFRITISAMNTTEKNTLESFYQKNRFKPFIFKWEGENYTVRFLKSFTIQQKAPDVFSTSVELIEFWGVSL